jgi:hypothetical protein
MRTKGSILSGLFAIALGLATAACSADALGTTSPSVLSSSGSGRAAASSGASLARLPVTLVVDPATCPLVPPGTGAIHGGGEFLFVTRDNGPRFGVTVSGHGDAVDGNGEPWHWSDADLFFSLNQSQNALESTITESFHLMGPRGKKIMVHGAFHVTYVNGALVVEHEHGNESEDNEACEGFIF